MVFFEDVSFDIGGHPNLSGSMLFSRIKSLLQLLHNETSPRFIVLHSTTFNAEKLNPDASNFWNHSFWGAGLPITAKSPVPIQFHVQALCFVAGREDSPLPLLPAFPCGSVFKFWIGSSCSRRDWRMVQAQHKLPEAGGAG